jgi:putative chitinase
MLSDPQRKILFDAAKRRGALFKTRADVADFNAAADQVYAGMEAPTAIMDGAIHAPAISASGSVGHTGLHNPPAFFDFLRKGKLLGPDLSASEVAGVSAILAACGAAGWGIAYTSYALGTAYLETGATMQPVMEANWLSEESRNRYFFRMYDINGARPKKARELGNIHPGDGAKFPGMGYPQMTGRTNYTNASKDLGFDLVNNPKLAMRPDIAAAVMIWGIGKGKFTTKKAADYLPASGPATPAQFKDARPIINGHDRDDDVAAYCIEFQKGLIVGEWGAL